MIDPGRSATARASFQWVYQQTVVSVTFDIQRILIKLIRGGAVVSVMDCQPECQRFEAGLVSTIVLFP